MDKQCYNPNSNYRNLAYETTKNYRMNTCISTTMYKKVTLQNDLKNFQSMWPIRRYPPFTINNFSSKKLPYICKHTRGNRPLPLIKENNINGFSSRKPPYIYKHPKGSRPLPLREENNPVKRKKKNDIVFDYLIVVDLEATCDNNITSKITAKNQEIIEFPWVVIDVKTQKIIDHKQLYVRPKWNPELTSFCTNLTGITTEQVSCGISLSKAIQIFDDYIEDLKKGGKTYCVVTDGEWDFKLMLVSEAAKKNIQLTQHYYEFIDLKTEFSYKYRISSTISLKNMLRVLKIKFVGHHHSGIDDCKNIAAIVLRMIHDGHSFTSPGSVTIIPEDFDPLLPQTRDTKGISSSMHNCTTKPTNLIRLRGLPNKTTVEDIQKFFAPLPIHKNDVEIVLRSNGLPSGTAFVQFKSIDLANKSMRRDRDKVGSRYVEVFRCTKQQIDKIRQALKKQT